MRRSWFVGVVMSFSLVGCRAERLTHPTVAPASEGSRVQLGAASDVLYVLDGHVLETARDSTGVPEAVRALDPDRIKSIEVLKGARAKRAYGDAGAGGVVIITTTPDR